MQVLLQVNVGVDSMRDPVLEILQFEKFQSTKVGSRCHTSEAVTTDEDPYGELLTWLLPLDRTLVPPGRPLSPPLVSAPGVGSASQRSTGSASSGSQLFSFGHFRSYSMPAMPPVTILSSPVVPPSNSKPSFDLEDFDCFSSQRTIKNNGLGTEGLLSFRGISLDPERFSSHCGLEGLYLPGRRWRKKLEIIQPIEIHSFSAECNTEDLICVQIKNVSPAHVSDIIIYIDAITIAFEEAPNDGPPISLPISCIEAGNEYSLPNLALRRGEEHSFILKPTTSIARDSKSYSDKGSLPTPFVGISASNLHKITGVADERRVSSIDQYAVLVSCRCNYTESKLFFKKPIGWRPRVTRDLMISVASEISAQTFKPSGRLSQLPVQALTLQASNLTYEDLTLTVLAPASFTSPPSVMSLNSAPTSPMSSLMRFPEFVGKVGEDKKGSGMQRPSLMPSAERQKENDNVGPKSDGPKSDSLNRHPAPGSGVMPSADVSCSHLWLQSTVPLGCVTAQSSATVKLELLPLTDGIITLDTLQVSVKERGVTYIPEHPLKIHATSSITTGIV
uniref:3-keto-steroid reductase n=1 Tax=Anthurium amnicola TaxID=1678845 RepID=A0A1D1XN24_9ARAE